MSGRIGQVFVDSVTSLKISRDNQTTKLPVESGRDLVDHVIQGPLTIQMSGVISFTPIGDAAIVRTGEEYPGRGAKKDIQAILEKRLPVIVKFGGTSYRNMILESLSEELSGSDGYFFSCRFVQIRFIEVSTELKVTRVKVPRNKKRKRRGHVQDTGGSSGTSEENSTVTGQSPFAGFDAIKDKEVSGKKAKLKGYNKAALSIYKGTVFSDIKAGVGL